MTPPNASSSANKPGSKPGDPPDKSPANSAALPTEASFSTLALSIGSSAAIALGLAPHPGGGAAEKDRDMARFNIDLLRMLRDKTAGNLTADEKRFLDAMIADLQIKFVQLQ